MDDNHDIDIQQLSVEDRNKFILGHFVHTWRGRVSDDTLYQHVLNIEHFANNYLNYSAKTDEVRSVDQATAWDVYDFLTDWLPRKSLVDSAHRAKSYLASFNKLFKFMAEYGYMPPEKAAEILQRLKEERQEMIEALVTYYDEPDEDQSHEAFLAELKELEARWKSLPHKKSDD